MGTEKQKGSNEKRIGLALGGGAILGAAHVGALKALDENNTRIDCLAGTSIGAIIGAFVAFGWKHDEMVDILSNLNWLKVSGLSFNKSGLLSQDKLAKFLRNYLGDVKFEDAAIPFAVVTTDITTGEKIILNKGRVIPAVLASACLPGVFKPVELEGRLLVDGGIVENVPISPLKEMGAETILAVSLNPARKKPHNMVDIMLNAYYFATFESTRLKMEKADVLLELHLSDYNPVIMKQIPDLINVGYEQANSFLHLDENKKLT